MQVILWEIILDSNLSGMYTFECFYLKVCEVYNLKLSKNACVITKTIPFNYIENFITKNWKLTDKKSDIFHISAQNIDCGYLLELPHWGGSDKYPQSMFLSKNKINNVYPCKPQFYYIKVGFKGGQNYTGMFSL